MHVHRGHESERHRRCKRELSTFLISKTWAVFVEEKFADLVLYHASTGFTAAVEAESGPRNVIGNATRDFSNGCHAVAFVVLDDRYFNQVENKVRRHLPPDLYDHTRLFPDTPEGFEALHRWLDELALSNAKDTEKKQ